MASMGTRNLFCIKINDGQSYLIASEWGSENAFNDFCQSDKFKQVTNWGKESILAGRPSHTVYKQ